MKRCKCLICNSAETKKVFKKNNYTYYSCNNCGVISFYPLPTEKELKGFYSKYKEFKNITSEMYLNNDYWPRYEAETKMTLDDITFPYNIGDKLSVLDVGCANGFFVRFMQEYGHVAMGIDISDELVQEAQSQGLNCVNLDINQIEEKYDLISMWDVIEHVLNPLAMLERVCEMLKDNGSVIISTPCVGVLAELYGERWRFIEPVEHINLFSQEALFNVLKENKMEVVNWIRFGSGATEGTIPSEYKSVFDKLSKELKVGDRIVVFAQKITGDSK